MDKEIQSQVEKRRTFAIISHPDAGKTTLTEKLLLFGGAIRMAGEVKRRKAKKFATSDWMQIEKERGISVTSSAMQFKYKEHHINILDTPGHQDFSEDTYRTLTAADSAVMLIDAAKGVETQTIKLFKVCSKRDIPIFTFINKMDRYGKDPLDLLEELEQVLGIRSCPMNWPIGMGDDFCGIYDRQNNRIELYKKDGQRDFLCPDERGLKDPSIGNIIGDSRYNKLCEDIDLLDIAGDPFDEEKINQGKLTPVYFGSAISKFGVQTFLDEFLQLAPAPHTHMSSIGPIDTVKTAFSGFIFKIQANMNPAHRDRIAFLRVCSGKFERGMAVNHVRSGKKIKLAQPQQFLAQYRDIVDVAYPGDIIGLHDPGTFHIGDTLCAEGNFEFERLPQFPPEHFARVINLNAMKYKQFQKGTNELVEEGTVQVFRTTDRTEDLIIGVVGELQFDVFTHRLKGEYGADIRLQQLPYHLARWVGSNTQIDASKLTNLSSLCVTDQNGHIVVLCQSESTLEWLEEQNSDLTFYANPYALDSNYH
ncbi:MAG: peptide chain release factor 3 [Syntrophomonadaceae bacterium]|nr:peptide chain release factor 3 [Syntrophomonadaceae bacterium]MDD4549026.1 peptide chain release factor 3 [Syntrophomonadaceae bacterium]